MVSRSRRKAVSANCARRKLVQLEATLQSPDAIVGQYLALCIEYLLVLSTTGGRLPPAPFPLHRGSIYAARDMVGTNESPPSEYQGGRFALYPTNRSGALQRYA